MKKFKEICQVIGIGLLFAAPFVIETLKGLV